MTDTLRSPMLSADELREIRDRCDKATPGPWEARHRCSGCTPDDDETCGLGLEIHGPPEPMACVERRRSSGCVTSGKRSNVSSSDVYPSMLRGQFERGADARFVAASRTDIPRLLAALAASEAEKERLRAEREMLADDVGIWLSRDDDRSVRLMVNCSDCFSFASADCEAVPEGEFWRVHRIYQRFGEAGVLAWAIERRATEPFKPYSEPFQSQLTEARRVLTEEG